MSTTTSIGILRDHASAYRALGRHLIQDGHGSDGRAKLGRAADLHRDAGSAYSRGVSDADAGESRKAARDAFDEACKLFREIGSIRIAEEIEAGFERVVRARCSMRTTSEMDSFTTLHDRFRLVKDWHTRRTSMAVVEDKNIVRETVLKSSTANPALQRLQGRVLAETQASEVITSYDRMHHRHSRS